MKPSWKDAPEWANWLCMDCEGYVWSELKPVLIGKYWYKSKSGGMFRFASLFDDSSASNPAYIEGRP